MKSGNIFIQSDSKNTATQNYKNKSSSLETKMNSDILANVSIDYCEYVLLTVGNRSDSLFNFYSPIQSCGFVFKSKK